MGAIQTLKSMLLGEDKKQIDWILKEANKRRPHGYVDEIPRRIDYINGDMATDGLKLLKQEFPKSYTDMEYKMIDYPIAQYIVEKRARAFQGRASRFYLLDPAGKEVPADNPIARSFAAMIKGAMIESVLDQIDGMEDIANGVAAFIWWDVDHIEVSPYDGTKCHMAINSDRYWDPYSSAAVAFEQESAAGLLSKPRYVVYAARDHEVADARDESGGKMFWPTLHYISDPAGDRMQVNDGDINPYIDRRTGKPMYPFTWFRSRKGDVYYKGGDQLVKFNRMLNMVLTYLVHNAVWQMASVPTFELPPSGIGVKDLASLKKILFATPRNALQLPPGVSMKFSRPDVQLAPFTNLIEMLVQYEALMHKLSPKSIDVKGGLPQSGIALKIEMHNLVRYIENRQMLLEPHVMDLFDRMISIWNLRATRLGRGYREIPPGYSVAWDRGSIDIGPVDYDEINARYEKGIEYGIYSVDDWAMAVHGVDRSEAQKLVDENLQRNAIVLQSMTRYPAEPLAPVVAGVDDNTNPKGGE